MTEQTETNRTIDLTPTWEGILPALIAAMIDGTPTGQSIARQELQSMARAADLAVTMRKAMQGK